LRHASFVTPSHSTSTSISSPRFGSRPVRAGAYGTSIAADVGAAFFGAGARRGGARGGARGARRGGGARDGGGRRRLLRSSSPEEWEEG